MRIAVYCGSTFGKDPLFAKSATALGKWIAQNGHTLVYGGGDAGLMGIVAKAAFETGTDVIGVIPQNISFIANRPQPFVTKLVQAADMSDRKKQMLELADVFVALPGGIGTMDEMTEAITLTRIGYFDKICVFINSNGFYEPFKNQLKTMQETGFIEKESSRYIRFTGWDGLLNDEMIAK